MIKNGSPKDHKRNFPKDQVRMKLKDQESSKDHERNSPKDQVRMKLKDQE